MVSRVSRKRLIYNWILDRLWPRLTGDPDCSPTDKQYFDTEHVVFSEVLNAIVASRLSQAEQRTQSVESKLIALLALASILSLAVTAGLAASISLDTVAKDDKVFAIIAVCLIFYVAVQLLRSLWCAVSGLVRRSYKILSPQDMVPIDSETTEMYQSRLLNLQLNHIKWNEWVVDQKVSEMAVAHEALRNVLGATFFLILLVLVIAVLNLS